MEAAAVDVQQTLNSLIELLTGKTIGVGALAAGGKLNPRQGLPGGSGVRPRGDKRPTIKEATEDETTKKSTLYIPILKADDEKHTVTGVVLQPEITDAQLDIIGADVIKQAAHDFLVQYNKQTRLGLQHKDFTPGRFALAESYIAPIGFTLNGKTVLEGSWVMVVRVLDAKIWNLVSAGKITGFSIGGKAKVQSLKKPKPGV